MKLNLFRGRVTLSWGEEDWGADLRFLQNEYRCGGPWIERRVVHDVAARYGFAFLTRGGWAFFGWISLRDQRVTDFPIVDPARLVELSKMTPQPER